MEETNFLRDKKLRVDDEMTKLSANACGQAVSGKQIKR
jgi:hypothetical protein